MFKLVLELLHGEFSRRLAVAKLEVGKKEGWRDIGEIVSQIRVTSLQPCCRVRPRGCLQEHLALIACLTT